MHRPWCSTSCSLCCCQLRRPWLVRRQRWVWSRRRPCTLNHDLWPVAKALGKPAVENDFGVVKRGNTDSQDEFCQSVKRRIWKSLLCTLPPSTLPFSRMSPHKGLSVFFSQTYPHNTPNERETQEQRNTRAVQAAKASEHIFDSLTDRNDVINTTATTPYQLPWWPVTSAMSRYGYMTSIYILLTHKSSFYLLWRRTVSSLKINERTRSQQSHK